MHLRLRVSIVTLLLLLLPFRAHAGAFEDALALYQQKRYPEARLALEKITASEPTNAAACHYLGLTLRQRADERAIEDALPWLAKAAELAPKNATYLTLFGISSMQAAGKTRSVSGATRGRDAIIRAIELEPDNLDAREALLQFYASAPWPIGSRTKAKEQAEAIAQRNPTRGLFAHVMIKTSEKKYDEAIGLCEKALEQNPDFYPALAELGRLSGASGAKLDRGLSALQRCLQLEPPFGQAAHSLIHYRIGTLHLKLNDKTAARDAFTTALQLDPKLKRAADALAKLES
jgi:tetratricopeptide (TPR) repeat protein